MQLQSLNDLDNVSPKEKEGKMPDTVLMIVIASLGIALISIAFYIFTLVAK